MEKKPNFFEQLLWSIIHPGKIFRAVQEKPLISVPVVLMIIAGIFAGVAAYRAAGSIDYSQLGNIPPQQAEMAKNIMKNPAMVTLTAVMTTFTAIISSFAGLFLKGLIMWGLVRMVGGKGSYMQSVSVVGLAWTPLFIRNCLQAFSGVTTDISKQVNSLDMANLDFSKYFSMSLGNAGIIFVIWNILLLTIGFSIVFNISKVKAALLTILYWIVGFLASIGLGWFSFQQAMRLQSSLPKP